jgi:transposase InsO family protein
VIALLDSGCTGSCIDKEFVRKNNIQTRKVPLPIPVYNADGSLNEGGPITEFVEMRMVIQDHTERIQFAVSSLGKTELFIGHEWLKKHNPNINWRTSTLTFDRCPRECDYISTLDDLEGDHDHEMVADEPKIHLNKGERLFAFDVNSYSSRRVMMDDGREQADLDPEDGVFKERVPAHYHEYKDVFDKKDFDQLPERRIWDHVIELTPDFKPIDCKIYPLSPKEQPALQEFIEENLRTGRIRPSKSPNASPFFFGMKPDGSGLRPIQDYRKLNEFTVKNRYPLPLIGEIIDKLKGAKYFTKLDVRWGFNNVRIHEGDEWKAAFRTNLGLYEPTVMFFGMTNSPATFQTMMNHILKDLINEGKVAVYLDDILIFTKDLNEHRKIVSRVLQILRENKLSLKPQKCEFEKEEMRYLGMIIGHGEVRMDHAKVAAVAKWPTPKNKKEVQQFLGFANYYRRFIKGFSGIAKPLTSLTGKDLWKWGTEQTESFEEIKKRICSEPVLTIPVDNAPYRLEADSSDYASGAVLSQKVNDKWHPIAYMSKALNETERNYEIYDKEMLAIMTALDEWRQYLMGASEVFEIWTDHQNLQYFRKPQKLNRRQARWVTELAEYHYSLHHKAGKSNVKPDILSRRPDLKRGENDNENIILLKPEHFRRQEFVFQSLDNDFLTRIKASSDAKDRVVEKALAGKEKSWQEHENGIITWQERIYVPRNKRLREDIIREHHDSVAAGHPGRYKTQELITRNYWWPYIQSDIRKYVDGCETCQRTKTHRQKPKNPLHPNEVPSGPWEHISVDLIGELPESQGFNAILVIVDRFSKMIIVVPTNMELSAMGMARIYRDRVWSKHGLPRKIISDRGPQFAAQFMKDLNKLVGITGNLSTAYHPQTNGQTERMNQEIEQYLRVFVNYRQSDWAEWLACAEFSYNDKVQSSTGFSPFYVNYGRHPYKGTNPRWEAKSQSAIEFVEHVKKVREETEAALKQSSETMKRAYDKKKGESREYQPGERVYLEGTNITTDRPIGKLGDKRHGPFTVIKKVGASSYKLKLPATWKKIHPVFNEVFLTPFTPPQYASQKHPPPPPPVIVDGEEEYVVEEIMDSKFSRGKLKYLVKWEGYPNPTEWTWEPEESVLADNREEFHEKHPNAPRRVDVQGMHFQPIPGPFTDYGKIELRWPDGKLSVQQ